MLSYDHFHGLTPVASISGPFGANGYTAPPPLLSPFLHENLIPPLLFRHKNRYPWHMTTDDVLAVIPRVGELRAVLRETGAVVWVVGGALRSLLLGQAPVDIDLATLEPEPLARRYADRIGGALVAIDPTRGIWRVALRGASYLDFCRFRADDLHGDLRGRDFTVNAIALRLPDADDPGGLVDPFHGVDDLNARVLRMTAPSAFADDPCRILRAFRFLAELDFSLEDATWAALVREVPLLTEVAPERLLAEWWKLCGGAHAVKAITRMDEAGALATLFPELQGAKGVTQNGYHHLDVWEHLLLVTTYTARFLRHPAEAFGALAPAFAPVTSDPHRAARLVFTALLHDVGKPETRTAEGDAVHFYGHETAGEAHAQAIGHRLRMSRADQSALAAIIRHHLRPLFLLKAHLRGELSARAMLHYFEAVGPYALDVLALALADKAAARGPAAEPDVEDKLRTLYAELLTFRDTQLAPALARPLLTGFDLTQTLRVAPGPHVGRLLARARELQVLGTLRTREDALRWAAEVAKQWG